MMKAHVLAWVVLLCGHTAKGQTAPALQKTYQTPEIKNANDSDGSIEVGKVYSVRLRTSPEGKGDKNEVTGTGYFPSEQNVVWIHFTAIRSAQLTIEIIPDSVGDDYDFLLFKDEGIQHITSKRQKPIRSNCARTQNRGEGKTGLSGALGLPAHVREGPGSAYSSAITVVKDEQYYLVLNNVYDHGGGVLIRFDYIETKVISGVVTDESKKPVSSAEVIWEDATTGDTLAQTKSDEKGKFSLEVPYQTNNQQGYTLVAVNGNQVFSEMHFHPAQMGKCTEPLALVLPELKKGKRMRMRSINFIANQTEFLSGAYPTLKRLSNLMKANPQLTIHIEGHTHGNNNITQELSENRALVVQMYLVDKGIGEKRITTEGLGGRFMLHADPVKNRRVEILVTNY